MGLPEIRISFQEKASSAIRRSSRGTVAVLLNDGTQSQFLTPFRREREVSKKDWTEQSLKVLKLVLKGGPERVVAVRMLQKDGSTDLQATLKEILPLNIDYLVYPDYQDADKAVVKDFLQLSKEEGKKVKAVLPNCAADDAHVINFATASVTAVWDDSDTPVTYTAAEYCGRIAGILAGLPLTQSCTYYVLDEVVDCTLSDNADADVDAGKLILVFDGEKYKLGRGVTSLVTVSDKKPGDLKKIKIVEGMDIITHDIYSTFEDEYVGKVVNSYDNKQIFVGAVRDYFRSLENSVLDAEAENYVEVDPEGNRDYLESRSIDTADMTEQELREANTGSWLFLTGNCKFLDAMEDLQLQVYM